MLKVRTIAYIVWLEMIRKKDAYVLLILLGALLCVLVSLNVFGLGGMVRYIKDVGLMMAWGFSWLLASAVSSRQIPQEEKSGTIYPLLAKPLSRFEFIVGKWIGTWTAACFATLMFYTLIMLVTAAKGGIFSMPSIIQGFILHCFALGIMTAIGILCSTRMNSDAAFSMTLTLTAASFIVSPRVSELVAKSSGIHAILLDVIYHVLPHFEVLDMRRRIIHNYGPISANIFITAIAYALVMSVTIIILAWLSYRKKRFSRSNIYG